MRPAPPPPLFDREVRRVHFLGVGGMGMAPLAIYCAGSGLAVSGEDDALGEEVAALLAAAGVTVGGRPPSCDLVVHSSAIPPSHPSFVAAARGGLPPVRRGEMLAEILRHRRLVAVCGAHGKTTTTAMLVTAMLRSNFLAGFVLGGLPADGSAPARVGSNEWVVAEIDESDGTVDRFSPEITVAVNIDWDHPDYYREEADLEATFAALFSRTRGAVLVSDLCARSLRLAEGHRRHTFGRSGDFRGEIIREEPEQMVLRLGGLFPFAEAVVRAGGAFNAANALAALAAASLMGARPGPRALADYPGVRRRQATLSSGDGPTVMEDYAHHPTEIRALLGSLRGRLRPGGRLIVVFQPHRFSRTARFKGEFAAALALADRVHLLDVYPAGEAPVAGGTAADIYAEMKRTAPALSVDYFPGGPSGLFDGLAREVRRADLVAFVGAGDIDREARAWIGLARAATAVARKWDERAEGLRSLLSPESRVTREEPLGPKTTLRVGGAARIYAEPAGPEDLAKLLKRALELGVPALILGRGSNLIVPDAGVDGVVVSLSQEAWSRFEARPDGGVWAGAGLRLKNLCGRAAASGLSGFEFLEGIPGSVGGALRMNAGAMGGWIFDLVEEMHLMTMAGEAKALRKAEMHFDYRRCTDLQDNVALGALLRPPGRESAEAIARRIDAFRRKRHESQPREPSAGCIFKNPPGDFAGRLIEECGLKGERAGNAEISPVHANFIINCGGATSADVLELIRRVRGRVRSARGVDLEPEVLLYGGRWEDVL